MRQSSASMCTGDSKRWQTRQKMPRQPHRPRQASPSVDRPDPGFVGRNAWQNPTRETHLTTTIR
ncbi:hypothetical protein BR93DRAFT_924925 [Coniochaeta sp. PMI_546]|nr:hypothetical protein BR93DRAFT_924925 [Coniochaeta sp. PMI_546]